MAISQLPKGDLGDKEPTRLCPQCQHPVTRVEERRGRCPFCGGVLLSLVFDEGFAEEQMKPMRVTRPRARSV